MTKLLQVFSMLAVLGFLFASVQPADAHGRRHHHRHWGHHHHHMMKHKHCHWMNQQVRVRHGWRWKRVRVCHR